MSSMFLKFWEPTKIDCILGGSARGRPVLSSPAPPSRPAVCRLRHDPPIVFPSFGFDKFPDMPCMKRVYTDKKASFHWSAARKKERSSTR